MSNYIIDMREKNTEINELQQNIMKLFELMEELQVFIQSQNELLDSIENNMKQVNHYLREAVDFGERINTVYISFPI